MQLLVDSDQNARTDWNGYDYIVNGTVTSQKTTTLKRVSDGRLSAVEYRAEGNELIISIPRALVSEDDAKMTTFDFHWIDNAAVGEGDVSNWWYEGDSAPEGRFNYRYTNLEK